MNTHDSSQNASSAFSPQTTWAGTVEPVSPVPESLQPHLTAFILSARSDEHPQKASTPSMDSAKKQDVDRGHDHARAAAPTFIFPQRQIYLTKHQEKVLTFFREVGHCVTHLKLISNRLGIPYGTLRHTMRRMTSLGFLEVRPYYEKGMQGLEVRYSEQADAFLKKTSSDPFSTSSPSRMDRVAGQHTHIKKDREKYPSIWNLSMEDLDTLWPAAKAAGLFPGHLRKVREAFEQQGWLREKAEAIIAQTLRYLDWQLEHGGIMDQYGKKVEDPVAYWFRSMQRHGYYQQPKGYVDPQLQALRQLEEEEQALLDAKKRVLAQRAERERLSQEEEIEKTLQALAKKGKEHPMWKRVYALLPGMLRQKVDTTGSGILTSPMVAGVIRADLRRLYGFQPSTKASCPKADTPAASPSTVF